MGPVPEERDIGNPLFREEAHAFQREKHLGEVLGAQPLSYALLTLFAVAAAISLIVFAAFGAYTRKAHVTGFLAPDKGLIKVYAPENGVVLEKRVTEGQTVHQGDALFVVSTERGSRETLEARGAAITRMKQRRDSLTEELHKQTSVDRLETAELRERLSNLELEHAQVNRELATQEQRVKSAADILARYDELLTKNFVASVAMQAKRGEWLDRLSQLQALQRERIGLVRQIETLKSELATINMRAENRRAVMARNLATIEQELIESETRRTFVITAPGAGVVTTLLAEAGQNVNSTSPLVSILPEGAELEAQLLAPSRAIGFLRVGQRVALRFHAFPYQRFGSHHGHIKQIARNPINPDEASFPVPVKESVYRVTISMEAQSVKAYGQEIPLQAGMLLDADIWIDRLRIIDWLFEPLYGLRGRL
jgi:membrane fusion protein